MVDLISFYLNESPDRLGRTLAEIWAMSDQQLLESRDVTGWLFPLAERSVTNAAAPVLSEKQLACFREDRRLQRNLLQSFQRLMQVFGLLYTHGEVQQIAHLEIWMNLNHNWLRFTRILRSLTLLGLHDEALAFYRFLDRKIGNAHSMSYWRTAVGLPPNFV